MPKQRLSARRIVQIPLAIARSRCLRRRRLVVELLEQRTLLNGSSLAPGNSNPVVLALPSPAIAGFGGDPSAGATQQSNEGVIALLFNPHQPKSALPANVTFAGGPPLQQGAPPRVSYNLEDNIIGAGALGPEPLVVASEGIDVRIPLPEQVMDVVEIVRPKDKFKAFVAKTPYGVPNFSFGPDTQVFGTRLSPPHQPRAANEPSRGESGGAGNEEERSPADEGAPRGDEEPDAQSSEGRGDVGAHRQSLEAEANLPQEEKVRAEFDDANFITTAPAAAACEQALALPRSALAPSHDAYFASPHEAQFMSVARQAQPFNAPADERAKPWVGAAWGMISFAPAALRDASDHALRRHAAEGPHWSRPARRLRVRLKPDAWNIRE